MFAFLDQYTSKGQFTLRKDEDLKTVCNAPKDCPGIYMVYVVKKGKSKTNLYWLLRDGRKRYDKNSSRWIMGTFG